MKFVGIKDYPHERVNTVGVLLVNLGTPDAPTPSAVRRYLKQFLSDPRVIEIPRVIWWCILNLIILPIRGRRSAHAYQSVWSERGSPLLVHCKDLAAGLQAACEQQWPGRVVLELAMSYGNPSIPAGLERMQQRGARRMLVLPLYPQYSATTTASVFDAVTRELQRWRMLPELRFVNHYYAHPKYAEALATSVQEHWQKHGRGEHLLVSFHGIPERYFRNGDPYHCHCQGTFKRLLDLLDVAEGQASMSFQSRVGKEAWLKPYTDLTVAALAQRGVRQLDVICPGFAVDCLETDEEIAVENRDYFLAAGGAALRYIPALNASPAHVSLLHDLIQQHASGWEELAPQHDAKAKAQACAQARQAKL